MSGRYELPGPRCRHVRRPGTGTLVSSHDLGQPVPRDEPLASTWVCGREACVEDAKEWVYASTHRTPLETSRTAQP